MAENIISFFVNGYQGIEDFFVNGWQALVEFIVGTGIFSIFGLK